MFLLPLALLLQTVNIYFSLCYSSHKCLQWLPDPPRVKAKVQLSPARPCMFWHRITNWLHLLLLSPFQANPLSARKPLSLLSFPTYNDLLTDIGWPTLFSSFRFFSKVTFSVSPPPPWRTAQLPQNFQLAFSASLFSFLSYLSHVLSVSATST